MELRGFGVELSGVEVRAFGVELRGVWNQGAFAVELSGLRCGTEGFFVWN